MPPNVKFCRNVVAGMGIFIFLCGIVSLVTTPAKWLDSLEAFGTAFMCLTIVREVNRREGDWHKDAFGKKQHTHSEPPAGSETE